MKDVRKKLIILVYLDCCDLEFFECLAENIDNYEVEYLLNYCERLTCEEMCLNKYQNTLKF